MVTARSAIGLEMANPENDPEVARSNPLAASSGARLRRERPFSSLPQTAHR